MTSEEAWDDLDSSIEEFMEANQDFIEVETHSVEWGAIQLDWCPSCLVTHEWVNVYTYQVSPMEASLLGPLWLCDDVLDGMDDEEVWEDDDDNG